MLEFMDHDEHKHAREHDHDPRQVSAPTSTASLPLNLVVDGDRVTIELGGFPAEQPAGLPNYMPPLTEADKAQKVISPA